ncbi:MAG: hypothetical protein ACO2PN_08930 [Pyrobaculum sp.]
MRRLKRSAPRGGGGTQKAGGAGDQLTRICRLHGGGRFCGAVIKSIY